MAPAAIETVPVKARGSDLSEPSTSVLGVDESSMKGFDRLTTSSGKNEIYLSTDAGKDSMLGKGM